ncbi:MAG: hypothetical protein KKB39_02300 [Nanoarchaeota archaeon]|nr:hypothetical protein [Nanoarchaeota archaeon]
MKKMKILIGLLMLMFILIVGCMEEIKEEKEQKILVSEKIKFSYSISIKELEWGATPEEFNKIIIDKNNVIIHQIFEKPNPCTNVEYTVIKKGFLINIVPEKIPEKPIIDPETGEEILSTCVQVIAFDAVEINLILSEGDYTINFYEFWNQDNPLFNETIQIEKYEERITPKDDTDFDLLPLNIFGCTSITAEVLEVHSAPETVALPFTLLVNSVNEYIPLESSEILLNKGEEITIYLLRRNVENLSIGDIIDISIRCLDGRVSSHDPFTKDECFWSADVDDIKNTKLCYKKNPGPIIDDALIPPDYEQAKGSQ